MSVPVKPRKKIVVNPTSGTLDLTTDNNFSYESVPENKILTIAKNNQMSIFDGFELEGELRLDGSLIVEE